jgi:Leucine-rich repeat (LRR) protein
MKCKRIALSLVLLLGCQVALSAAIPASERQALIDFYNSTGGNAWYDNSGWKTLPLHSDGFALPGTENTWFGVITDAGNTTVLGLKNFLNYLAGILPASLGNLSNLLTLELFSSGLTGNIPTELGNLINLKKLNLGHCQLTGSILPSLANLSNLQHLDLSYNRLTGGIPPSLGNLMNLESIDLSFNYQLTGSIPVEIGNLSKLQRLVLSANLLSGSIPEELGNLNNLITLQLFLNQLTGSIPASLGKLNNLLILELFSNQLSGSIPTELGNLSNLTYLSLSGNRLSGCIPGSFGNLKKIEMLLLSGNRLSGNIPTSLANLINLRGPAQYFPGSLWLQYNALYTSDAALIAFLNSKSTGWKRIQTIAPTNVSAIPDSSTSIIVSWNPIAYDWDTGSYRIFVSTDSGGPYTFHSQTANKKASSLRVKGLSTGIPHYFVVQTRTDPNSANQNTVDSENSDMVSAIPPNSPYLYLSKKDLVFGAVEGGPTTSAQSIVISNVGEGSLAWTVESSDSWLLTTPALGWDTGKLNVSVNPAGLTAGTYTGTVSVTALGAANSPQAVSITLRVVEAEPKNVPIGSFDSPIYGSTVMSSIAVTGWALDDIEVTGVKIYRDPFGSESAPPNGLVYIGDAVFVEGARPDVETAYPDYPLNYRAGWGYMLLTNCLPGGGNGTFTLHAIARDKEGNQVSLGQKVIVCDNQNAVKPFGAIDTPTQGGTAFGTGFVNFGWALTPLPKSIPIDGLTITAWVDGLPLGHPTYNNFRPDIASLFPGYANSNGAVGFYYLDTTSYLDGVHTIAWSVEDSDGAADGIGSRYFQILNTGSGSTVGGTRATISDMAGGTEAKIFGAAERTKATISDKTGYGKDTAKLPNVGIIGGTAFLQFRGGVRSIEEIQNMILDKASPVHVRRGYSFDRLAEPVFPNREGRIDVSISELERVAIYLDPAQAWETREELEARGCELRGKNDFRSGKSGTIIVPGKNDSRANNPGKNDPVQTNFARKPGMTPNISPYPSSVPADSPGYAAFLLVGTELRPLPIGSTFDAERGVLYWQPGPGFLGDYDFVFVDCGRKTNKAVKIRIGLSRKSR